MVTYFYHYEKKGFYSVAVNDMNVSNTLGYYLRELESIMRMTYAHNHSYN